MTQMDISRLPVMPYVRPATTAFRNTQQPASAEAVERVETVRSRRRSGDTSERAVQGELLHRERHAAYQSTRAFIDERNLEQARPAGQQADSPPQSRSAISSYLQNTSTETGDDSSRGRAVNFFV